MKFTKDEIRKGMLLYAVTDQSWLQEGQTLLSVCEQVLQNGATFLQIREKDLTFLRCLQTGNYLIQRPDLFTLPHRLPSGQKFSWKPCRNARVFSLLGWSNTSSGVPISSITPSDI